MKLKIKGCVLHPKIRTDRWTILPVYFFYRVANQIYQIVYLEINDTKLILALSLLVNKPGKQRNFKMCLIISVYQNRVASLFESSENFLMIKPLDYDINQAKFINVSNNALYTLIRLNKNENINTLICGAMRGCVRHQIEAQNIKVIPWITGDIQNVVQAFLNDNLFSSSFLMPGCRGRHQQHRFGRGFQ